MQLALQDLPGAGQTSQTHLKNQDRLLSGTQNLSTNQTHQRIVHKEIYLGSQIPERQRPKPMPKSTIFAGKLILSGACSERVGLIWGRVGDRWLVPKPVPNRPQTSYVAAV
jgi:hypothetical protein